MAGMDPMPIAVGLAAAAERIGARYLHRATEQALEPDDYEAAFAERQAAGLAELRQRVWERCIPSRFLWATVDDFTDHVRDDLVAWGEHPAGRNVLLLGPLGCGKSHAAVAAARLRFDRGAEIRFLPVVELLDMLRPGGPDNALYDLADLEVLILDDLGTERPTEWTSERLYALVNRRWLEERPTICTSNLAAADLERMVGPRIYSRLVGNGSVGIGLSGPDRRRTLAKGD